MRMSGRTNQLLRVLCLVLAGVLLFSLVACAVQSPPLTNPDDTPGTELGDEPKDEPGDDPGDEPGNEPKDEPGDEPGDEPVNEPAEEPEVPSVPAISFPEHLQQQDFGGALIMFLEWKHGNVSPSNAWMPWDSIGVDTTNAGNDLTRAIYERNAAIEDYYNVTLYRDYYELSTTPYDVYVKVDERKYDVLITRPANVSALLYGSTSGYNAWQFYATDLTQYSSILSLDQPWWNPTSVEAGRTGKSVYFATPSFLLQEVMALGAVFYNTTLAEQHDLDLLSSVKAGTWTLEEMVRIGELVAKSTDGNDKIDSTSDIWGGLLSNQTIYDLLYDTGESPVRITAEGKMEKSYRFREDNPLSEALDRIVSLVYNNDVFALPYKNGGPITNDSLAVFGSGNAMFFADNVFQLMNINQSGVAYGLLPTPKVNKDAQSYTSLVSIYRSQSLMVPEQTSAAKETIMTVLEAMAYISYHTVVPYVEQALIPGTTQRDLQNREMLNLIRNSRIYDESYIWVMSIFELDRYLINTQFGASDLLNIREAQLIMAIDRFNQRFAD